MVRRGSPVRVRKRALQRSRKSRLFLSGLLQKFQYAVGMEPLWSLQVRRARSNASEMDSFGGGVGLSRRSPGPRLHHRAPGSGNVERQTSRVDVRETAARSGAD